MKFLKAALPIGIMALAGCETVQSATLKNPNLQIGEAQPASQTPEDEDCCAHTLPVVEADLDEAKLKTKLLRESSFRHADGDWRIQLTMDATQAHNTALQAHVDYLTTLYPCINRADGLIVLSEGDFGTGHTSRRVTPLRWFSINPNGNGPVYGSNIFDQYFSQGVHLDTTNLSAVSTEGLKYNQKYAIEYSIWINQKDDNNDGVGDCHDIMSDDEIQRCWGTYQTVNFEYITAESPGIRAGGTGPQTILLRIYDDNGKIVSETPTQVSLAK